MPRISGLPLGLNIDRCIIIMHELGDNINSKKPLKTININLVNTIKTTKKNNKK